MFNLLYICFCHQFGIFSIHIFYQSVTDNLYIKWTASGQIKDTLNGMFTIASLSMFSTYANWLVNQLLSVLPSQVANTLVLCCPKFVWKCLLEFRHNILANQYHTKKILLKQSFPHSHKVYR